MKYGQIGVFNKMNRKEIELLTLSFFHEIDDATGRVIRACAGVDIPTVRLAQHPAPHDFKASNKWPPELGRLYDEAATAYAAGAHTATAIVCRKVLMACACNEGESDGKKFVQYVDFIVGKVLTFPKAAAAISAIKKIGNDANHKIEFVSHDDA